MNRLYRLAQRWSGENPATVALTALGVGLVAAAFAGGAFYQSGGAIDSIVKRSPCASDPAGDECQTIQRRVLRNRSVRDACITARKLDRSGRLLRLTKCIIGTSPSDTKEVVPQSPSHTAPQQPGPRSGGRPETAPPAAPSAPTPPVQPKQPAPIRETVAPVVEGVKETACSPPVELCP